MNSPENSVVGFGLAIIDKIGFVSQIPLSQEKESLLEVTAGIPEECGGVIPNVLSAFVGTSRVNHNATLLACVGMDEYGDLFERTLPYSIANIQRSQDKPTAMLFDLTDQRGQRLWKLFPDACVDTAIRIDTNIPTVFMTDLNTYRISHLAKRLFGFMEQQPNIIDFCLNLSGITGMTDMEVAYTIANMGRPPEIIFGNNDEFNRLDGNATNFFSQSRLRVQTNGEDGSTILFEGTQISIPTFRVKDTIINTIGCGDSYMGAFLALLLENPQRTWNLPMLTNCGNFASFIAAHTGTIASPRLPQKSLRELRSMWESTNHGA